MMHDYVVSVTDGTFQKEVLKSDRPVVVDFWAAWCGPCKQLSPIVEEVARVKQDVKFCKLNVDENPNQAGQYQIMSIPTLIFFDQGRPVDKVIGLISKEEMLKRVAGLRDKA